MTAIILACVVAVLSVIPLAALAESVPEALFVPYCLLLVTAPGAVWLGVWWLVSDARKVK